MQNHSILRLQENKKLNLKSLHRLKYNDIFVTECSDGWYGDGCKEECGQCTNLTLCSHEDGLCMEGCKSGFKGALCKQCKLMINYSIMM